MGLKIHRQIVHTGVTLAVCSCPRCDGFIEIELALGDPRQAARIIPAAQLHLDEVRHAQRGARAEFALPAASARDGR